MPPDFSALVLGILLGIALLLLPGLALLRLCLPARKLGFLSRVTIAPGVTVAVCVVLFAWCELAGLKLGPLVPWSLVVAAGLSLLVRRRQGEWRFAHRLSWLQLRRIPIGDWLAGLALVTMLAVLLIVRSNSTRGWVAPPGADSAQHTVIVQLLLENRGLFQSWAPYSDAETFTYHFGFHAVTAMFAWMSGSDAAFAVLVMARTMGLCAVVAIFALVRLWTRSIWGGVFAAALWELSSWHLYFFDLAGRWTLLAGLTMLPSALVLLSLFLSPAGPLNWRLGLLCITTAAGLILGQYKTGLVFAALAGALFVSRFIAAGMARRRDWIIEICLRTFAIVIFTSLLVAPRLSAVLRTTTGTHLKRVVLEAQPANADAFSAPAKNALELLRTGFANPQQTVVSSLALLGVAAILLRRRGALWFALGWGVACLMMNPALIGIDRLSLIDQDYWAFAVQSAVATLGGLAIGLVCETLGGCQRFTWSSGLFIGVLLLSGWSAVHPPPLPEDMRFILPQDLPVMSWMKANVPGNEKIAGRGTFYHQIVQGRDAAIWVPYFTRHQTNHTLLAAALEKAPPLPREKARSFTSELYARDMSTPESAVWMQAQGYCWFYSGANAPEILPVNSPAHNEADLRLSQQLARNPALEVLSAEGAARLYRVR